MLAARLLMNQGIEVTGITFVTPFFSSTKAEAAARQVGFPLIIRDITAPHLEMVKAPPSGYGANMNPCIDCHVMMVSEAGAVMEREGIDFIFTGEVLGQRPMSQNRQSLNRVRNLSGRRGLLLRPLSALLLEETIPEAEGKVDRGRLLDIQGRSRKRQLALAEEYGITDFPSPAGGCLLTDPGFSRRLKDLFEKGPAGTPPMIEMLKLGRHFRLRPGLKVAVGRNREENERLTALRGEEDTLLHTENTPGPTVILSGTPTAEETMTAAALCARYSDARSSSVTVSIEDRNGTRTVEVKPLDESEVTALRL
jgi:tRNA-specific 2-thiouridylase